MSMDEYCTSELDSIKKWMENMDQKAGIIVNIKKADVDSQPNMSSFWLMASVAENRGFTMIYDPNLFFFYWWGILKHGTSGFSDKPTVLSHSISIWEARNWQKLAESVKVGKASVG